MGRSQARRQLTVDEERDLLAQQAMQRQSMQAPPGMIGSAAPKKRGGLWNDIQADPLAFILGGPGGAVSSANRRAAEQEAAQFEEMLGGLDLDPMSMAAAKANPEEFFKAQSGLIADRARPQVMAKDSAYYDPTVGQGGAPVFTNKGAPPPPTYDYLPGQGGYRAVNKNDPKDVHNMGFSPIERGGITIGKDAAGNDIIKIGGPGQDNQQLTGPTKPEASYYKDVGSYEAGKAQRDTMLLNLKKARDLVSWDSTGVVGQVMKNVGGSKAVNLQERLKTVKTLIGFDKLQQMRNNSPTGGALGAITEKELAFLQSVEGSLEQIQSDGQLNEVLDEVEASIGRIAAAQDAAFAYQYQALGQGETRGQPRSGPQGLQVIPGLDAKESEEFRRLQQKFGGK